MIDKLRTRVVDDFITEQTVNTGSDGATDRDSIKTESQAGESENDELDIDENCVNPYDDLDLVKNVIN